MGTVLLAWFLHVSNQFINRLLERAIISAELVSFSVQKENSNWDLSLVSTFENIGKSQGLISIESCSFQFPKINDGQIVVRHPKTISLAPKSRLLDTVKIRLPPSLHIEDVQEFGSFQYVSLKYRDHIQDEYITVAKDSIDIDVKCQIYSEVQEYSERDYWSLNEDTGDSILVRGIYKISIDDSTYTNYFFPATSRVSHKIEGENIIIEYEQDLDDLPFIFDADEAIEDIIRLANQRYMALSLQSSKNGMVEYENLEFQNIDPNSEIFFVRFMSTD